MQRTAAWVLSTFLVLGAFTYTSIVVPRAAQASSATTTVDVELRAAPSGTAPVIAVAPVGSTVSIDGPPEGGFYPVTFNGAAGWVPGMDLLITKDTLPAAQGAPTDPTAEAVPPGETASAAPAASPVADPAQVIAAAPDTPVTTGALAAETASPADGTMPAPPQPADAVAPPATVEPALEGPAQATTDLNLRTGPSAAADVLFLIPSGSTVMRTGSAQNGFVAVTYQGMAGWVAADYLDEPPVAASEPASAGTPNEEDARTPRPGSGVAFTTAELPLRAGPSATESAVALMPAGSRVILTGVAEAGYHRVDYRGALGWADSAYLSTPEDPTPVTGRGGRGGEERRTYTRDEIVKIIYEAADRYGQSRSDMLRVAECESSLDPYAVNPSGSYGLFQFIRSTWESTPYGDEDIFDPRANANAAGWMWSVGRRNEWVCR